MIWSYFWDELIQSELGQWLLVNATEYGGIWAATFAITLV